MNARALVIAFVVVSLPVAAEDAVPEVEIGKIPKQLEAETLTDASRAFLKMKMKNHVKDMKELSIAVAIMKMSEVQRLAQNVANAPRLDPVVGPAAQLPTRFFDLQNELKKNAQALSDAGKANDANTVLAEYKTLITTCTTCHLSFKAQVEKR